jgi:predicted protein tyrosine phosphatase
MREPIDQVHPQLWIANITGARTQGMDPFDAVVTVCQDSIEDHIPEAVAYHFFEMSDGPTNEYGGRWDYEFFEEAVETVLQHLEAGHTLLVHCHAGQSRSASVSIAALAEFEGTTYREMYSRIDEERPQVQPDSTLEAHAQDYLGEDISPIARRMRERARERDADE